MSSLLGGLLAMTEDKIKANLQKLPCGGVEGINVAQETIQWRALLSRMRKLIKSFKVRHFSQGQGRVTAPVLICKGRFSPYTVITHTVTYV
jgi:hypothetical protein